MTVFDVFTETPYDYLVVSRGGVYGNRILDRISASGVLKLRSDMVMQDNREVKQSASTLHIRPSESFANDNMVGQGISAAGQDFEIIGLTAGRNYDTGELEHYTLTLQNSDYADFTEGS